MVVLGSTTKEICETYVEQVLSPALGLRRVVVTDNLAVHKGQQMQSRSRRGALATALLALTSRDARGFFEHCGYRLSAQPL